MKRRRVIAATAAVWGAAHLTGLGSRAWAAAKPGRGRSRGLELGAGANRYACVHDWGLLPERIVYGLTHGIVIDGRGHVHVLHTSCAESPSKDTVVVFDREGKFVRSWGAEFEGTAHGMDLVVEDGREVLYITDLKRGLYKTTLDGKVMWRVAVPEFYRDKADLRYRPSNVAVAPNGDVYLSDGYGAYFIHHLDREGRYKRTFAGPRWPRDRKGGVYTDASQAGAAGADHADKGKVNHPHGLTIDTRGREPLLIVAENDPGRLQVFSLDGEHHSFVDVPVRSPRHFAQRDGLMVIPDLDGRVTLLDEKNRVVSHLGDGFSTKAEIRALRTKTREHFVPGKFVCPHDAAIDRDGSIFIAEWVTVGRITKLQKI